MLKDLFLNLCNLECSQPWWIMSVCLFPPHQAQVQVNNNNNNNNNKKQIKFFKKIKRNKKSPVNPFHPHTQVITYQLVYTFMPEE